MNINFVYNSEAETFYYNGYIQALHDCKVPFNKILLIEEIFKSDLSTEDYKKIMSIFL